jgi:hypothetical protein
MHASSRGRNAFRLGTCHGHGAAGLGRLSRHVAPSSSVLLVKTCDEEDASAGEAPSSMSATTQKGGAGECLVGTRSKHRRATSPSRHPRAAILTKQVARRSAPAGRMSNRLRMDAIRNTEEGGALELMRNWPLWQMRYRPAERASNLEMARPELLSSMIGTV